MLSRHTLKLMGPWAVVLTVSRALQAILVIAALAVDGNIINTWNQNQYQFNSYFSDGAKADWNLNTTVGGTPFTGVVLAASLLTLGAIAYDQAFQHCATIFWDLYGVLVLELMVAVFWVASFAGMASYVGEMSFPMSIVSAFAHTPLGGGGASGVAGNTRDVLNQCIVVAVLGALIFVLALSNILVIIAYVVQNARLDGKAKGEEMRENLEILPPGVINSSFIYGPSGPSGPGPMNA